MTARPSPLGPGSRVRVVAPSGPVPRDRLDLGLALLATRGFEVQMDEGALERWRYLAGPDPRRLAELSRALSDPEVDAVWVARGGYGAMRLLEGLPWSEIEEARPRWLVGFSDATALHAAVLARGLGGVVHGPNLTTLGDVGGSDRDHVFGLLEGSRPAEALGAERLSVVRPGIAQGRLLGGNLSVLSRLCGTPFLPDLSGCLLFLEDVGERPYRLDRMLTHLDLAGVLRGVAGFVLGGFSACDDEGVVGAQVLAELLGRRGVPVVTGFPAGHGDRLRALPLGVAARLDASTLGRIEILEAPWSLATT